MADETFVPQAEGEPYAYHIDSAEAQVKALQRKYLKRWGWEETSSTPGSFWLWRRDFADYDAAMARVHEQRKLPSKHVPYGIITAPTDLAIRMTQSALDEQLELAGSDEEDE